MPHPSFASLHTGGKKRALEPSATGAAPSSKSCRGHAAAGPTDTGPSAASLGTATEADAELERAADIGDEDMISGVTGKVSGRHDTPENQRFRDAAPVVIPNPTPLPGSPLDPLSAEARVLDLEARLRKAVEEGEARLRKVVEENEAFKREAAAAATLRDPTAADTQGSVPSVAHDAPPLDQPVARPRSTHDDGDNFRRLLQWTDDRSPAPAPAPAPVDKRGDGGGGIVKDRLLGELIELMENSEFDPKLAEGWIRAEPSKRAPIAQENSAKGINHFSNSSYVMVADTQVGKTLSFLFLIFKAALTAGMPAVLLTKNNTGEVGRFKSSATRFNKIVKAAWVAVKKAHRTAHPQAADDVKARKVPLLKMTDDRNEFDKLLSNFKDKEMKDVDFLPVFVSLTNVSRIKVLAKDGKDGGDGEEEAEDDDSKDSICCMLLKHGFVDFLGVGKLRAMIVFDEADQMINGNVDRECVEGDGDQEGLGGINKKTQAMFMAERSVGRLEDDLGTVLAAPCLFDLFSATVDVTATPHSLFLSGRDLTSRANTGIITVRPSKYGFQCVKRPHWKSKVIDRMEVKRDGGVACMLRSVIADKKRDGHAAVIDSRTTRQKTDQTTQALRYAAEFGDDQLITSTWSSDGVAVFVKDYDEESDECGDSADESGGERVGTKRDVFELVQKAFNKGLVLTGHKRTTMYKLPGTEWHTEDEREARAKEKVDAAKVRAETAPAGEEDDSPLLYRSTDAWETEESLEEARVRGELIAFAGEIPRTTVIVEFRAANGSYPLFIDRFHEERALLLPENKRVLLNTVVFGKDIMDRGVALKGADTHACGLTDMYVGVESHCTLVIQVCGRLCGNEYHDCDDNCPAHGEEETCPLERKTLWATKDVHDLHENSLNFVNFLVATAGKSGQNTLETLEALLEKMETTVKSLERTADEGLRNDDLKVVQLFARKATGGRFEIEERVNKLRARLRDAHGFDHVGKYVAPGVIMADRVVYKTRSTEEAAADGGDVSAGSESEVAESESDESESDESESDERDDGDDAVVHVGEMDDSDYFLPNLKARLDNHFSSNSKREAFMVWDFKTFISDYTLPPPTDRVFVWKKRGFKGYDNCLVVWMSEHGLETEVVGDKEKILEKFEALRMSLHQPFTDTLLCPEGCRA